jgi:hypothetical protein
MPRIPNLAGTWISGKFVKRERGIINLLEPHARRTASAQLYYSPVTACITGIFLFSQKTFHLGSMDTPRAYCEAFNNIQESKFIGDDLVRFKRTVPWTQQYAAQTDLASLS